MHKKIRGGNVGDIIEPDGPERIVYQGRIVEVVDIPIRIGKNKRVFEAARRSPGSRLIIPSQNGTEILITKEHRLEAEDSWDYRLPGGKVFDSLEEYNAYLKSGRDLLKAAESGAKIEAKEEVGIEIKKMHHFATSNCGSTIIWDLYYFVVDEFVKLEKADQGEGENIEAKWLAIKEVKKLALSGKMQEDRSVAVIMRYLNSVA